MTTCSNLPGNNVPVECPPGPPKFTFQIPASAKLGEVLKAFKGKQGAIEKRRRIVRVTNYNSKNEKLIIAQLRAAGIRPMNGIMDGSIPVKYYEIDEQGLWYGVREFYPVRIIK